MPQSLAGLLLERVPGEVRGRDDPGGLEEALAALLAAGRKAWPGVCLAAEELLPFIAARVSGAEDAGTLVEQLARLRAADLYLACACARGDERATAHFRQRYYPEIARVLRRLAPDASLVEDVQQTVYLMTFVGEEHRGPRIDQYSGRGPLGRWLQVVATRTAQNLLRGEARTRPLPPSAVVELDSGDGAEDQELLQIKRLYRDDFNQAFAAALEQLSSRERNILRYRLQEGLGVGQIAELYRVHRLTVTRWFAAIRERLLHETREELRRRLGAGSDEVESLVRVLQSQIDASIRRHLAQR
jgi:RNA polymerase sigma-70 factor (ECF subfamily)